MVGESKTKFRSGDGGVLYTPVSYLFSKPIPRNNILIGDDPIQIRFVEQLTGLICEVKSTVNDDDLFGRDGILYRVLTANGLNLSPQVKSKVGVWSLAPITSGSAGANALVKAAAHINGESLHKDKLESVSRQIGRIFERREVEDLRIGLWESLWCLGEPQTKFKWVEPWESHTLAEWAPIEIDLNLRLGTLFKTLRAYVLIHTSGEKEIRKLKLAPHKLLKLKDLTLNPDKVYESLKVLSRWKNENTDPLIIALCLTQLWN